MLEISASMLWIVLTFLFAGWVKGAVGMGLPTVAMGLLGLGMAPVEAATLLVAPSFVTNVWQLAAGPRFLHLVRRLMPMMIGLCLGTALGIGFLTSGTSDLPSAGLGAALVAYGLFGLSSPQFLVPAHSQSWLSPLVGVATGAITGATGIFVVPAVPYLSALGLEREELIQALGLSFTVSTVALAIGLAATSSFQAGLAWTSLLAAASALAGMAIGQAVRQKLRPEVFRQWFFFGLVAIGLYMLARVVGNVLVFDLL